MMSFEFALFFCFLLTVSGIPIDHLNKKISAIQTEGSKCDSEKCAGVCTGGVCKIYSLIGEECGGSTGKICQPCQVCMPDIMGLPGSKGECQERLRCNNEWCDGGFCFVQNKKTGNYTYLRKSAPPVSADYTQKCIKYSQFEDRCSGAETIPPADYQYCPEPLQCYRGSRTLAEVYGLCRLPACKAELCFYRGQQFIDGYCGTENGKLCCRKYREEGESCGGLGPKDAPFCNPASSNCVKEKGKLVCRESECLKTCTGEFCLPDANGTNAICGGVGAPKPTTPSPSPTQTYYGGVSLVEAQVEVEVGVSQLPPICCAATSPLPPKPAGFPPTFLELAALHSNQQFCCPPSALCPSSVGIACTTNPVISCASCASAGLYQTPCPPPTYTW